MPIGIGMRPWLVQLGAGAAAGGGVESFTFSVKTDNAGTSAANQFTIPLYTGETYDFSVAYDGQDTAHAVDTDLTLTFPSGAGTYEVVITGTFAGIYFNNSGDSLKIVGSITSFGDLGWRGEWANAFYGCFNLIDILPALPDNITSMNGTFWNCLGLTCTIPTLPSPLINGSFAFTSCGQLVGGIPTLPATLSNGFYMFASCGSLDGNIADQSHLDGTLSNVSNMFNGNSNLAGSSEQFWNWDTPPSSTGGCYTGCTGLDDYATIPAAYGGGGA